MVSEQLRSALDNLRSAQKVVAAGTLAETRRAFDTMADTLPVGDDLRFEQIMMNGVQGFLSTSPDSKNGTLLYFHGGGYVLGSAWGFRGLIGEIGRQSQAQTISVDYRLAPEHPWPAAIEDGVKAYCWLLERCPARSVAFVGDSAGGGLALATLLAIREQGIELPSSALLVSPWTDLACTGHSFETKAELDPVLQKQALRQMAASYLGGQSADSPGASPAYASLAGMPPILVQVGSFEVLLDDATNLATRAAADDVSVSLEVWPQAFHGWQSRWSMIPEGHEAIRSGGRFLRRHLE